MYYRYIQDIWELDYSARLQIHVFKCQWVKHPNGVSVDNYGLTLVDQKNVGNKDDHWVLADRVTQVFYVLDPETGRIKFLELRCRIGMVQLSHKTMHKI
jgi:hypothetical protein